jgi:hypothetical protein
MIHPPFWLTDQDIDSISSQEYGTLHKEFMDALEEEELKEVSTFSPKLHSALQRSWDRGTFWCSLALNSPTPFFKIF